MFTSSPRRSPKVPERGRNGETSACRGACPGDADRPVVADVAAARRSPVRSRETRASPPDALLLIGDARQQQIATSLRAGTCDKLAFARSGWRRDDRALDGDGRSRCHPLLSGHRHRATTGSRTPYRSPFTRTLSPARGPGPESSLAQVSIVFKAYLRVTPGAVRRRAKETPPVR